MKRIISIVICLMTLSFGAVAQINFSFLPELYGRSVDGLGAFQVQNLGAEKMTGQVYITVKENTGGQAVVTVITPFVGFNQGLSNFPRTAFSTSFFQFGPNAYGAIANQTRSLAPGQYTFCFKFIPQDKVRFNEYENCFDAEIEPLVPLTLLHPAHLDTICMKRPVLSWQPPMPFGAGMRFRLMLTEKGTGTGVESMLTKAPLLFLDNISSTTINYPSVNPELKEGKTYYWQVVAYEKGVIISKSEIWEFTVQCKEPDKPTPNDSYRELKLLVNGNYYIANRALKFSFNNNYNIRTLRYTITEFADGGNEIKHLPEVKLQRGFNRIDIDLVELDLKPGRHYLLKVYPFNEPAVEVRFIYSDEDNKEM